MAITIKAARVNAGFTQTDVAEYVGKSKNTIASYESYVTIPDINVAQAMAEMFGMTLDEIIWTQD